MSSKIKVLTTVAILAIVSVLIFILVNNQEVDAPENANTNSNTTSETINPVEEVAAEETTSYTLEEVALKNSEQECWTIINESVYDITSYIPRHPGGNEILLACGNDGTSLFTERKTADGENVGSGTPHSSGASNQLNSYFIGRLEN